MKKILILSVILTIFNYNKSSFNCDKSKMLQNYKSDKKKIVLGVIYELFNKNKNKLSEDFELLKQCFIYSLKIKNNKTKNYDYRIIEMAKFFELNIKEEDKKKLIESSEYIRIKFEISSYIEHFERSTKDEMHEEIYYLNNKLKKNNEKEFAETVKSLEEQELYLISRYSTYYEEKVVMAIVTNEFLKNEILHWIPNKLFIKYGIKHSEK